MKEFLASWKVKMSMVGGVVIIATAYGTCSFDPNEEAIKEKVEETVQGKSEKSEAPEESAPIPKEGAEKVEGPKEAPAEGSEPEAE